MKIKDYMTKGIVTCDIQDEISTIAEIMEANNIGFIAVEEEGKIIGVLTDRDIVIGPVMEDRKTIEDYISKNIVSIEEDQEIDDALLLMKENQIKRLLITKKGKYTGVVSLSDFLESKEDAEILNTLIAIKD